MQLLLLSLDASILSFRTMEMSHIRLASCDAANGLTLEGLSQIFSGSKTPPGDHHAEKHPITYY